MFKSRFEVNFSDIVDLWMATLAVANPLLEEKMNRLKLLRMNYQLSLLPALVESMLFAISKLTALHPADNTLGLPQLILSLL